jgi:diazepam-binding inhibitor (GABA receptor modulating acyl-CoA-binding protein)
MSNLASHFEKAAADIKKHGKDLSNDQLKKLYGLYKQATVGDNNTSEPSFYQLTEKAKWSAWNLEKGKSSDQAKHEYVEYVLNLLPEEVKKSYS